MNSFLLKLKYNYFNYQYNNSYLNNIYYHREIIKNIFNKNIFIFLIKRNLIKKLTFKVLNIIFFKNYIINTFLFCIKKTLFLYTKNRILLNFNFFFKKKSLKFNRFQRNKTYRYSFLAPILSSKIIAEFISYHMDIVKYPKSIFFYIELIRKWHIINVHAQYDLEFLYQLFLNKKFNYILNHYGLKKFPLLGLRIECSGTKKKGDRKYKWFYGDFLKGYSLITDKAPNNSFSADLDYYQLECTTYASVIGIKVWTYYKTHFINKNGRLISLLLT